MASDQMLPNSSNPSKKQQALEAGKKRLEEFRKKKAAAKKAASSNSNGDLHEVKSSVPDATTSNAPSEHSGNNEKKTTKDIQEPEPHSIPSTNANHTTSFSKPSTSLEQPYLPDAKLDHGVNIEINSAFHHPKEDSNSSSFNHFSSQNTIRNGTNELLKDFTSTNPFTAQSSVNKSSHIDQRVNGSTYRESSSEVGKSLLDGLNNHYPQVSERNNNNALNHSDIEIRSESISTSFKYDSAPVSIPSTGLPSRRSRPSFLDSILPNEETDNNKSVNPFSSKVHPVSQNFTNSSSSSTSTSTSVPNLGGGNGGDLFRHSTNEIDNSYNSSKKQNEDFAALEQHIEDLTQEKFSLQRALEASRVLAESLATENSALTDTYNQQGGVVNQLKLDMERLQDEIKAQLVELEAMRTEYGNAQLECSAADERAKLLASEVIGLEEKALRLRSNELKLERQLENLEAEMSSQKRKISSLEKDREDLQFTIEALQEEKKMLQSKIRKAPVVTNPVEIKKPPTNKKEVSTSTDDLVDESEDDTATATSNLGENRNLGFEVSTSSIPPDQVRMIQNIQTLISELALEKEELVRALSTELSQTSKLKDLNKELSQKLEVQTQRLELLTSQNMVIDNNNNNNNNSQLGRKAGPHGVVDNTQYADEGDEVVERVLGWIMKLFPGGPSRRQNKHL